MWRRSGAVLVFLLYTGSAIATPAPPALPGGCLDPSKPYSAKWVAGRDVIVTASTGKQRPEVRVTTDCISLDAKGRISVTASGACLAVGDPVVIRRAGEPAQTCKVKAVGPNGAPS
jgi:hypothetical protein